MNYASAQIATGFKKENRSIFANEKRFEANSSGVFNLPVEDNTLD
jgi:hypothetical protein